MTERTEEQMADCRDVERVLWTDGPDAAPREHLQACTSCQKEARRAGDVQAALSGMRMQLAVPPADLEDALLTVVTRRRLERVRDVASHPKFWRGAAVGAAAAGAAAVGLIVARRISTRPEPELAAS